jgi:hypothetical protein
LKKEGIKIENEKIDLEKYNFLFNYDWILMLDSPTMLNSPI